MSTNQSLPQTDMLQSAGIGPNEFKNSELTSNINPQKLISTSLMVAGGLQVLLGIGCIAAPMIAAMATEVVLGMFILMVGLADAAIAWEFQRHRGRRWRFLRAASFVIAGAILVAWPLTGVVTLAFFLGVTFILEGAFRLVSVRHLRHFRSLAFMDGGIGIFLGIFILSNWPADSAFILGTLVGIRLAISGVFSIVIGAGVRKSRVSQLINGRQSPNVCQD